jgi:flagellar motor switch protein FliG
MSTQMTVAEKLAADINQGEVLASEVAKAMTNMINGGKEFNLPSPHKAAVLCIALGEELSGEVFKHLSETEIEQISQEVASIEVLPKEEVEYVIKDFYHTFLARSYVRGVDYAKKLLAKAFGADAAKRILDKILRSSNSSVAFESIRKVPAQQLCSLLQSEHPQTIALVLAHLDASTAASALNNMPENTRAELIMRMANFKTIPQDIVKRVSVVLEQKLKSLGEVNQNPVGGVRSVAEMCNRLDRETSRKLLEQIEIQDAKLALSIRDLMVTFDDILLLDDVGIREIIKLADKKTLTIALKGAVPEIKARFFANMSARAAEMLKEDMEYLGQIKAKDTSAAQKEIVNIMRELDEKGIISLTAGES